MKFDIKTKFLSAVGLIAVGSYTLATFLIVVDELFTLAFYCRTGPNYWDYATQCGYSMPFFGTTYGYIPWEIAFGFLMVAIIQLCAGFFLLGRIAGKRELISAALIGAGSYIMGTFVMVIDELNRCIQGGVTAYPFPVGPAFPIAQAMAITLSLVALGGGLVAAGVWRVLRMIKK